jgi:hypothetical protein
MWRDRDRYAGAAIDSSGVLPDGTPINGPDDLRAALLRRPEQFVQTFTEGLMTYATGRKLEHYDMPTVRKIVRSAASSDYRFSTIVQAVVRSEQFRMRRVPQPVATEQRTENRTSNVNTPAFARSASARSRQSLGGGGN